MNGPAPDSALPLAFTSALADLERRGLAHCHRAAAGRCGHALFLTKAGQEVLQTLSAHAAVHDQRLDELGG